MEYEVKRCKGGWYWRIVANNHKVMSHSETYKRRRSALLAAIKVKMKSISASITVEE